MQDQIAALGTIEGTPLYDVAQAAYDEIEQGYDAELINAVVLLSDGDDKDSARRSRTSPSTCRGRASR